MPRSATPISALPAGDGLRRLEALRPRFEALHAERIRADSEVERLTREEAAARAEARAAFGTDDPQAIAEIIEADRRREAAAIASLEAGLTAIEARLAALGGE